MLRLTRLWIVSCLLLLSPGLPPLDAGPVEPGAPGARVKWSAIDVGLSKQAISALQGGNAAEADAAAARIQAEPSAYNPEAFYVLGKTLFDSGRRDEGAFWFYAGQLRARFDANRCADVEARQVVGSLTFAHGEAINKYTFQDPDKLMDLIRRVVEWDRTIPHDYDQRWINLQWNEYMTVLYRRGKKHAVEPLSLPSDQWQAIAEETRLRYQSSMLEGIQDYKEQHPRQP